MRRSFWRQSAGLAAILALGGCVQVSRPEAAGPHPAAAGLPPETVLPVVDRGMIAPPAIGRSDDALVRAAATGRTYRGLGELDCQCLAARNSVLANLIDEKAGACACAADNAKQASCSRHTVPAALHLAALEARNRSAGDALELFFRLAETEAKADLAREGLAIIDSAVAMEEKTRGQGARPGPELDTFLTQRATQLGAGEELNLGIEKLNSEIRKALRIGPASGTDAIRPIVDWEIHAEPIDVPGAVAVGLAHRPEIVLFRLLCRDLNPDTMPAAEGVLAKIEPLLGTECKDVSHPLLAELAAVAGHPKIDQTRLRSLIRQLNIYREERERAVAEEIRLACATFQGRERQVGFARELERERASRLDEALGDAKIGRGTAVAIDAARLKHIEARADVAARVMAWWIARARLKQAQGMLAAECGFAVPAPRIAGR